MVGKAVNGDSKKMNFMKFGILGTYWTIVTILQVSTLKENMLSTIVEDFFFHEILVRP